MADNEFGVPVPAGSDPPLISALVDAINDTAKRVQQRASYSIPLFVNQASSAVLSNVNDGGTFETASGLLSVRRGTSATGVAIARDQRQIPKLFDSNPHFFAELAFSTGSYTADEHVAMAVLGACSLGSGQAFTRKHIGFMFQQDSDAMRVFGTIGTGVAQVTEELDLTGISEFETFRSFYARSQDGVTKFFISGIERGEIAQAPAGDAQYSRWATGIWGETGADDIALSCQALGYSYDA